MKELKTLKLDSDMMHFFECYKHNKELVGRISIRQDIYDDYIKILSAFPLKDKKLKYFLKLDAKQKCGYMSSYLMKIARKVEVPKIMIEEFSRTKRILKIYNNNKSAAEIGKLFVEDIKKGLIEYKYVIKKEIYKEQLAIQTHNLCLAIFEQFDKARLQMLKNQ
ncbi:MAG: hypothetical protein HPY57_14730 [Ignavibacteria bacterium]|nr:hypothetical protein [Ignavibacteria bacterium]